MKVYEIVFSFLDPTQAMGTIEADSPEEAVNKLRAQLEEASPAIKDLIIESIKEVADVPEDLSTDRTLN
jgi:hypothetical protein